MVVGSPPDPDPNLRGSITKVKRVEKHEKQIIDRDVDENEKSVVVIYDELVRQYAVDIKNNRKKAAARLQKINRSIHLFKSGIMIFIIIFLLYHRNQPNNKLKYI